MTIKNLTSLQKQIEVFNNDFSQKQMQDQQSLLDLSKVTEDDDDDDGDDSPVIDESQSIPTELILEGMRLEAERKARAALSA